MRAPTVAAGPRRRLLATVACGLLIIGALLSHVVVAAASGTSVISGDVFQDLNRNGVQDPGEAGFANLRINLFQGGVNVAAAYTDSAGAFTFSGLADGAYVVAVDGSAWNSYNDAWVPTTIPAPAPNYLFPQLPVSLTGSAAANLALRPIVRSTTAPISVYQAPDGMLVQSWDDVVPAQAIYDRSAQGQFMGTPASPYTTINFDFGTNPNVTSYSCTGSPGAYTGYTAVTSLTYSGWRDELDDALFHEHGHAWSMYTACMVQRDLSLNGYLQARGLLGNPLVGSSYAWDPREMIAEDYRELFGTATAASYSQMNTAIPPASQVAGLKTWLEYTFTTPPTAAQPSPVVTSVTPADGPAAGGTQVTVAGSSFTGSGYTVVSVTFGGVPAASFSVVSATQITAVAPAGASSVDVVVTTQASGGQAVSGTSSADLFTYAPVPTVTSLSPSSGTHRGGTSVTVTGSGFSGPGYSVTAVLFGGVAASGFTVLTSTSLTAVSPPGTTGTSVAVTVRTAGGTSATSRGAFYTYTRK